MNIYYKVDVLLIYMKRRNVEFQKRRKNINRKILLIIAIIFSIGICAYTSVNLHFLFSKDFESMLNLNLQEIIKTLFADKRILLIFIILETIVITFLLLFITPLTKATEWSFYESICKAYYLNRLWNH